MFTYAEEVARKKPITVADQIATDENGRRRFHGAFTGGFSAGYYNTVGSKEGWVSFLLYNVCFGFVKDAKSIKPL